MKLLNSFVSPFAARARLAIYAYGLPVEIAPSGQWLENFQKSPDYLAINPTGRVPALVLDDETVIPESGVIVEYLADAFPGTGLRGGGGDAIGNARLLAHLTELYVQMPGGPLIGQIFSGQRDLARIQGSVAAMDEGLSYLNHFMPQVPIDHDHAMTIADCALVPFLFFFADLMVEALDQPSIIDRHPAVAAYWRDIQAVAASTKIIDEMRAAIAKSPLKALLRN